MHNLEILSENWNHFLLPKAQQERNFHKEKNTKYKIKKKLKLINMKQKESEKTDDLIL